MKIIHFEYKNKKQLGVLDETIRPFEIETNNLVEILDKIEKLSVSEKRLKIEDVKILAPIEYPSRNIFCLGKNYFDHAKETQGKTADGVDVPTEPIYFSKVAKPALEHEGTVEGHVGISEAIDYEVELAIIIGKEGKNISKEEAKDHIFGYTICNDISARDLQVKHIQWHKGKSLDGFCPLGPLVVTRDTFSYPPDLKIQCYVNDELRQDGITSDLIFDLDTIISDLSKGMTLYPGDIILTGTPAGVGMGFDPPKYLKSGDKMTCQIEGIGQLINYIK